MCALLLTAALTSVSAVAPTPDPGADLVGGPLPVIPGLNADYLDGQSGEAFAPVAHDHDDRYYTETESDGRFLGIGAKAVDADLLDGQDSAAFASAGHTHDQIEDFRTRAWSAENTGYVPAGGSQAGWSTIPGLEVSVSLPRDALVQMSAYGAQRHVSGGCHSAYRVSIDGVPRGHDDWGLGIQMSGPSDVHHLWSMLHAETLAAGDHTVAVQVRPYGVAGGAGCHACAEGSGQITPYERCLVNVLAVPV